MSASSNNLPAAPTQRLNNRSGPAIGLVEPDVTAIDVGLQNADEAFEMLHGMFA
jgi:hypothetical protein